MFLDAPILFDCSHGKEFGLSLHVTESKVTLPGPSSLELRSPHTVPLGTGRGMICRAIPLALELKPRLSRVQNDPPDMCVAEQVRGEEEAKALRDFLDKAPLSASRCFGSSGFRDVGLF